MLESIELVTTSFGPDNLKATAPRLRVSLNAHSAFHTPLIAYDLPWHATTPGHSRLIADGLDALGIAVGGLRSEFRQRDSQQDDGDVTLPLAICPYRPDRFGLLLEDLQNAKMIDIRLHPNRDDEGLPFYPSKLLRSWDQRASQMADRAEEMYGGMQAIHWPPDVASISHLSSKVTQLRQLAPQASICISMDAYHAPSFLSQVIDADPDTIGINASFWPAQHAESLIELIVGTADLLRSSERKRFLLLVPPRQIDLLDCLKLLALGTDFVAIDSWCESHFAESQRTVSPSEWAASTLGITSVALRPEQKTIDFSSIGEKVDYLRKMVHSMGLSEITQIDRAHLRTYSRKIDGVPPASKRLG